MTKLNLGLPLFVGILSVALASPAYAYNIITTQLDPGDRGTNVTNLQTFFADNASMYPSGLITGYFGGLTKASVIKFQSTYGLGRVGRVGPVTLNKINELISNGGWSGMNVPSDLAYAPFISNVTQYVSGNSANFSWTTNENATARVFYGTMPITINEGDINSVGFGIVSGYTATNNNYAALSQQVTISNLLPNTTYYYMIVATDVQGNVSVHSVNNTFRTN